MSQVKVYQRRAKGIVGNDNPIKDGEELNQDCLWVPQTPGRPLEKNVTGSFLPVNLTTSSDVDVKEKEKSSIRLGSSSFPSIGQIGFNKSIDEFEAAPIQEQVPENHGGESRCFASEESTNKAPIEEHVPENNGGESTCFASEESSNGQQNVPNLNKHDNGDLKKGRRKKPKRKKHRPKVVVEGKKPKKSLEPKTPKVKTPKLAKPKKLRQPKAKQTEGVRRRKSERKCQENSISYNIDDVDESASTKKTKPGRNTKKTCKRVLNFSLATQGFPKDETESAIIVATLHLCEVRLIDEILNNSFLKTCKKKRSKWKRKRRLNTLFMPEPRLFKIPTRRSRLTMRLSDLNQKLHGKEDLKLPEPELTCEKTGLIRSEPKSENILFSCGMEPSIIGLEFHSDIRQATPLERDGDSTNLGVISILMQVHVKSHRNFMTFGSEEVFYKFDNVIPQNISKSEYLWDLGLATKARFISSEEVLQRFNNVIPQSHLKRKYLWDLGFAAKARSSEKVKDPLEIKEDEVSEEKRIVSAKRKVGPLIKKLKSLVISYNVQGGHGALVLYQGRKRKISGVVDLDLESLQGGNGALVRYQERKRKISGKVDLDSESLKMWYLLTDAEDMRTNEEKVDRESKDYWKRERELMEWRITSFCAKSNPVLGDRRFRPWNGSVLDSLVGVYLTQNVGDIHSSSAYMSLAAMFPLPSTCYDPDMMYSGDSQYYVMEPEPEGSCDVNNRTGPSSSGIEGKYSGDAFEQHIFEGSSVVQTTDRVQLFPDDIASTSKPCCLESYIASKELPQLEDTTLLKDVHNSGCMGLCEEHLGDAFATSTRMDCRDQTMALERINDLKGDRGSIFFSDLRGPFGHSVFHPNVEDTTSNMHQGDGATGTDKKTQKKQKIPEDWEAIRRMYSNGKQRHRDHMDSVNWEAVRCAKETQIADAIKARGQQQILAGRIKTCLNEVFKLHGSLDLEWLRDAPPDKVKEYLLEIRGIGLKSTECVRLLALQHHAFPVDTNVCRIAVRLGWVPLQTLPGELQIHDLEEYPLMDSVQKYLWPRLCHLEQTRLYELHYQMITFGKVFCTKRNPNCGSCPMKGDCKHYASAIASKRPRLSGPSEKGLVDADLFNVVEGSPTVAVNPIQALLEAHPLSESGCQTDNCEPIIEVPQSPEHQSLEQDIEDLWNNDTEDIPTIKLQDEEFKENLEKLFEMNNIVLEDSRALVNLPEEAKHMPVRKLKTVSRLRTEHLAYVLPDNYALLRGFERREVNDLCPYLLVIWLPGETSNSTQPPQKRCASIGSELCNDHLCSFCNSIREQNAGIVRGTILIPCRTANRGRFPLNGTYFQVNEVFADHETSKKPLLVPRNSIATLPTRTVCFGSSAASICRALDMKEITECFRNGYICVRGFERSNRAPRPLQPRFHCSPTTGKRKPSEDED